MVAGLFSCVFFNFLPLCGDKVAVGRNVNWGRTDTRDTRDRAAPPSVQTTRPSVLQSGPAASLRATRPPVSQSCGLGARVCVCVCGEMKALRLPHTSSIISGGSIIQPF